MFFQFVPQVSAFIPKAFAPEWPLSPSETSTTLPRRKYHVPQYAFRSKDEGDTPCPDMMEKVKDQVRFTCERPKSKSKHRGSFVQLAWWVTSFFFFFFFFFFFDLPH